MGKDNNDDQQKQELKETHLPQYEKQHYQTLTSLYKTTGTLFLLLVAVVVYILGDNLNDVKDNVTFEVSSMTAGLNNLKASADSSIKYLNESAQKERAFMRQNLQDYLMYTKDLTSMQIEAIREDARNLALSSAREKIYEAFEKDLSDEINLAAQNLMGTEINFLLQQELNKYYQMIKMLPAFTSASTLILVGERAGLDTLVNMMNSTDDPSMKQFIEDWILQKGIDYENSIGKNDSVSAAMSEAYFHFSYDSLNTPEQKRETVISLIKIIDFDQDLEKITSAFLAIRKITGIYIKNFDMNAISKLKENYKN